MNSAVATAAMLAGMAASAQTNTTDQAIRAIAQRQAEAWNRNDAAAFSQDFADDAMFINVRGDLVKGRGEIERIHTFIFNGPYKQTHYAATVSSIDYPAPTIAVAQVNTEVSGFKTLPPGLVQTEPGVLRTRFIFVLAAVGETWKIVSGQNTAISPAPMPMGSVTGR